MAAVLGDGEVAGHTQRETLRDRTQPREFARHPLTVPTGRLSLRPMALPDPERFQPLSDEAATRWARYGRTSQNLFVNLVGLVVAEVRLDYCRLELTVRDELKQAGGVVHGGVLATLLDTACVPAVGSDFKQAQPYSTINMSVQYQGAATQGGLVAAGWVTRRGRSIVFCEAEVATTRGDMLAKAALTFKVASAS